MQYLLIEINAKPSRSDAPKLKRVQRMETNPMLSMTLPALHEGKMRSASLDEASSEMQIGSIELYISQNLTM